jgi:hypothetical protein
MDITEKIDSIISEATVPSQGAILSAMSKGLEDVKDITGKVGMSLWHYFNLKIVGKKNKNTVNTAKVFNSSKSNKLADELWFRIGKSVEDSEALDDKGLKKLKSNFYSIVNKWDKVYTYDKKVNAWEFTG